MRDVEHIKNRDLGTRYARPRTAIPENGFITESNVLTRMDLRYPAPACAPSRGICGVAKSAAGDEQG